MNRPVNPAAPAAAPGARDAGALIQALAAHRRQARDQAGYWNEYCGLMLALCRATAVLLAQRDGAGRWSLLGHESAGDDWASRHWEAALQDLGERSLEKGYAFTPMQDEARRLRILATVRTSGLGEAFLIIDIPERERGQLNEMLMRAMLATDFPDTAEFVAPPPMAGTAAPVSSLFANAATASGASVTAASTEGPAGRPGGGATDATGGEATAPPPGSALTVPGAAASGAAAPPAGSGPLAMFDLAAQVMSEKRFRAATLLLVNGVASHYGAAQVALGWLNGGAMRTVAISHVDRFEHNTENVHLLEDVFLEVLGQPGPVWRSAGDTDPLYAAHAKLGRILDFARLYALPVKDGAGATRALLLFGFKDARALPPATGDLTLAMGFLQPWLQDLQQRDRWWGARFADWGKQKLSNWIGPGHVWGRAGAALLSLLILFAVLGKLDYRVEASSQLTTDSTRLISAQFDGRVETVLVSAGDVVKAGTVMATLDTRDLRQQELDIRADRERLGAEADKARAAGNLAELGIAEARYAQADARLARIVQYLAQATAVAPFDGVVVAGERKDLLNAPVKKGDNLFRVARIDGLYIEILVPERDVRYVRPNARGELRLLSRPDESIPFQLATFIPMAQVKGQEGNHFLVKAKLQHAPESWWRPGMSGIVMIDGGRQNVTWILTHKLVDTLRMKLWWLG